MKTFARLVRYFYFEKLRRKIPLQTNQLDRAPRGQPLSVRNRDSSLSSALGGSGLKETFRKKAHQQNYQRRQKHGARLRR